MKPILCHICDKPLNRYKMRNGNTRWACYFPVNEDEDGSDYMQDETEDLVIITNPKQHGKIVKYFASIKYKNQLYYINSDSETNTSSLFRMKDFEKDFQNVIYYEVKMIKGPIPKFYDLKLKEPLGPQFEKIFNNLKLLITFI